MRTINYHGNVLSEKHYILPANEDDLALPIIKTPCYVRPGEIDLTFCTQEDAKVKVCPECGCDVIFATIGGDMNVSHWHCLRGHDWNTERGIIFISQMELFVMEAENASV
jgi:hypothetical protein